MTYPEHMPYFDALRVSYDGLVRLRRYTAPLDTTSQWIVLTTSGRITALIDLPAKLRVFDFDGDRILIMERDSDDLEYIALYQLVAKR